MKKLVCTGLIVVAGVGVLALGGVWWLKAQVSREAVEAQLQAVCSGRVTLGDSRLDLLSSPARWRLVDLKVFATAGRDGQPEPPREPVVSLKEAVLEISLGGLAGGVLDVQRLNLDGLSVQEYVSPEGVSDLAAVLKKPGAVAVAGAPKPAVAVEPAPGKKEKAPPEFRAEKLGLTLRVREARLSNSRLYIHNRVNKTKTRLEDLNFALTEIDVDPANLAQHNQANLELAVKLTLDGRGKVAGEMQDVTFARVDVSGRGKMQPFDDKTGAWSPVSEWELTLAKGSTLAGYMTLGQANAEAAQKMRNYGIDLSDLPMGGELLEPAVIKMAFGGNQLLMREDARFQMPAYEVRMAAGSWVNSAEDAQDLNIRLVCGDQLQGELRKGMLQAGLPDKMADAVVKAFTDEASGRLSFDVRADGKLTRPNIKPAWDKALERVLQSGGLDALLKSLVK